MTFLPPLIVKWLATEPIVQNLSEIMQRRFFMICFMQSIPEFSVDSDASVADALSIGMSEIRETKSVFMKRKLIDASWRIVAFGEDVSGDEYSFTIDREEYVKALARMRMKRYRARKKAIESQSEGNFFTMR